MENNTEKNIKATFLELRKLINSQPKNQEINYIIDLSDYNSCEGKNNE